MNITPAQQTRRQALERAAGGETTVITLGIGAGASIVARNADGEVVAAEVVNDDGVEMPGGIAYLTADRSTAKARLDELTDAVIDHVEACVRRGETINVSEVAKGAGVARKTVYNRLAERGVEPGNDDA